MHVCFDAMPLTSLGPPNPLNWKKHNVIFFKTHCSTGKGTGTIFYDEEPGHVF